MTDRKPPAAKPLTPTQYQRLFDDLSRLLERGRRRAEEVVGRELLLTYHAIGHRLLAARLAGQAGYGTATIQRLADELGLNVRVLQYALAFAKSYPEKAPETGLRWGHYRVLLDVSDQQQRGWYEQQAAREGWTIARLTRAVREKEAQEPASLEGDTPKKHRKHKLARPTEATYVYEATVERVVDGDTLLVIIDLGFNVLKRERLRLARLDTPPVDSPAGAAARDYVQEELARVEFVMLKTNKIDIYGRYVAHVFYQPGEEDKDRVFSAGRYLNQKLLDEALAKPV